MGWAAWGVSPPAAGMLIQGWEAREKSTASGPYCEQGCLERLHTFPPLACLGGPWAKCPQCPGCGHLKQAREVADTSSVLKETVAVHES